MKLSDELFDLEDVSEPETVEKKITYIRIDKLYPHPDNPRKDVGDVSELAESIKAKGIMQNLTVVPGHRMTKEEWITAATQDGISKRTAELMYRGDEETADGYTVIIGHRRMAAAKLAGLTELPCVIVEMSMQDQIATMLLENMQRSDLTVYEEACGIQMMLDFGDTVESVSEQTGLSKATVRRRVKLLEFDRDKFKASLDRGATLFDYEKLEKIKDPKVKNELLDYLGTKNFDWEYRKARDKEKNAEKFEKVVETVKSFAKPFETVENKKDYKCIRCIGINSDEVTIPDDAGTKEYYYTKGAGNWFDLYTRKTAADIAAMEERNMAEMEAQKRRAANAEIAKRAFELRKQFIKHLYVRGNDKIDAVMRFAFASIIKNQGNYRVISDEEFCSFTESAKENHPGMIHRIMTGDFDEMQTARALFICAYSNFHDSYMETYMDYNGRYRKNDELELLYGYLEKLGYVCSDEERAWRDGKHGVFCNA